jgi:hypothetical protein
MDPRESCRQVEDQLQIAAALLGPSTLDSCLEAFRRGIELLEMMVASNPRDWDPGVCASLPRIRNAAQTLKAQIVYSANFLSGWTQVHLGVGYTRFGQPTFLEQYSSAQDFEG